MFILLWLWRDGVTLRISLPNKQFFPESPTFEREWTLFEKIAVIDPLVRPIPRGYSLIVALNDTQFPYATKTISQVRDLFNTDENGVYFLADNTTIQYLLGLLARS